MQRLINAKRLLLCLISPAWTPQSRKSAVRPGSWDTPCAGFCILTELSCPGASIPLLWAPLWSPLSWSDSSGLWQEDRWGEKPTLPCQGGKVFFNKQHLRWKRRILLCLASNCPAAKPEMVSTCLPSTAGSVFRALGPPALSLLFYTVGSH